MSDNEKPELESARTTLALNSSAASADDPMQADEARMRRALGLYGDQARARATPDRTDPPPRQMDRFTGTGHTGTGHTGPGHIGAGHKRRFVNDGEVPVTLVHGLVSNRREHADGNGTRNGAHAQPTNRLEVAEAALAAEIATRERIDRALQEAQTTIHDLQTKLGHAELARQEAVETLRREREAMIELRASLQQAKEQAAAAHQAHEAAERAVAEQQERMAAPAGVLELEEAPPRPRRGRKPRVQMPVLIEPTLDLDVAEPRKSPVRGRPKDAAPGREPKPIRWWITPRVTKKR